jgi:predicted RNA methylase
MAVHLTKMGLPEEVPLEDLSPGQRLFKRVVINPFANHMPASLLRGLLKFSNSRLAAANWADPGGWESMVISYNGRPEELSDKVLVKAGAMPMALRNRKRLGAYLLAQMIDQSPFSPVHVLCLGAGPGLIIMDALELAHKPSRATLVDLNPAAFEFGMNTAAQRGLGDRVRYIQSDIRHLKNYLDDPPHVVKMLGICEYLSDEQLVGIASAVGELMPEGCPLLANSLSMAHGNNRFFQRVFGLHMIHRSSRQVAELIARAGFGDFIVQTEPLGVYDMLTARKLAVGKAGG